jgi:nitrate/nitrite transporter NarK
VPRNTRLFNIRGEAVKPFTAVWISHMLIEVFLLMHPALVPVFMKEFNLSVFDAGLIITVPSLCRLIFTLPVGILADKFGPRHLVILSVLISGLAALLVSQSATA